MPYLANLHDVCGNVLDPAWCLAGCFLLIAFGIWSLMSLAGSGYKAKALCAGVFGAALVAVALPGIAFSETWITCSLSDRASPSAGVAPKTILRRTAERPHARRV
jgi:hypothetical protein